MGDKVDQHCLDTLILKARTQNGWLDRPVTDDQLRQIYDIMKQGPTSANTCPARILFLRVGGMSGFDNAKVDAAFFPDGRVKSNFLCNVGYGDPAKVMQKLPRLEFEEACQLL